jgi:predicted DNA-binding transcriptional regulator YafY
LLILDMLRSRKAMTVERLARECVVSERTVYRDLRVLADAGAPIYSDRGVHMSPEAFLPPLNLTPVEYTTVRLALKSLPQSRFHEPAMLVKSVLAKLAAGAGPRVSPVAATTGDRRQHFVRSTLNRQMSERNYRDLQQAVRDDLIVEFSYENLAGESARRRVDAYFLVFRARAFYLIGFCHLRHDFRLFRLDRIRALEMSGAGFQRRPMITPERFFKGAWEVHSGDAQVIEAVFFGSAARVIRTGHHHESERIERVDRDRVKYTATVAGLAEVSRWLLGFGGDVEVLSPPELVETLKSAAQAVVSRYP